MTDVPRMGRPRATSPETIAEAACELFFEQGYDGTSIGDITRRAGVARASFFNYFRAKSDVLWSGFDARLAAAFSAMAAGVPVADALARIGRDLAPDTLALAITNADAMGLGEELERQRAERLALLQREISRRLTDATGDALLAQIHAAAYGAGVLGAVWMWAERGAASVSVEGLVQHALSLCERFGASGDSSAAALA
ncbi:AcrR family transcriptional regulator [Microbacterium sp. SORGH_AS428]|uniref:TetR/AcrR family transcriptional regulator n=1 Tax=Microbacterium sp. SORGH_AS_0428 TaxID=3041788 RepID=UPI0028556C65|nr:helix-turn-helix domain-containing protein [Microbacterium sp. SORGH_AS_0428]MDR6198203.1 AcrR family transcriptional regulator [Microbacterium sp. SORGH_AS_0428]